MGGPGATDFAWPVAYFGYSTAEANQLKETGKHLDELAILNILVKWRTAQLSGQCTLDDVQQCPQNLKDKFKSMDRNDIVKLLSPQQMFPQQQLQ